LCSNVVKFSDGKSLKSCVIYLTKNNSSAVSETVATARIAPKICDSQPPTVGSHCSRFHPNQFTFGGVIAERVNTVLLPRISMIHPKPKHRFGRISIEGPQALYLGVVLHIPRSWRLCVQARLYWLMLLTDGSSSSDVFVLCSRSVIDVQFSVWEEPDVGSLAKPLESVSLRWRHKRHHRQANLLSTVQRRQSSDEQPAGQSTERDDAANDEHGQTNDSLR